MTLAGVAAAFSEPSARSAVRVMVVDDSAAVRGLLSRWLDEVPGISVVSTQPNGLAALRNLERYEPDVVVLDIEMPEMDGITALPLMLKRRPDLVVVMASALTRRNAEISLKALELGAKDYVPKPEGNHGVTTSVDFRRELIEKVRTLGRQRIARQAPARPPVAERAAPEPRAAPPAPPIRLRPFSSTRPRVLAIGASTGGPQALYTLLKSLSPALGRVPVLVTQHMPPTFTRILAEQITAVSGRPAAEGCDGEPLLAGRIYVAPGGRHMSVRKTGAGAAIAISDAPPVNYCKPAVDPLFESVGVTFGAGTLALILTGMGSDGAKGCLVIAEAGGSVIAQDEASSVVWGMPGVAARAGACAAVLPLGEIAAKAGGLLRGDNQ